MKNFTINYLSIQNLLLACIFARNHGSAEKWIYRLDFHVKSHGEKYRFPEILINYYHSSVGAVFNSKLSGMFDSR